MRKVVFFLLRRKEGVLLFLPFCTVSYCCNCFVSFALLACKVGELGNVLPPLHFYYLLLKKPVLLKCKLVHHQTFQFAQLHFNWLCFFSRPMVTFTDRNLPACTPKFCTLHSPLYSDWPFQSYDVGKLADPIFLL